jgi:hypothetical protein
MMLVSCHAADNKLRLRRLEKIEVHRGFGTCAFAINREFARFSRQASRLLSIGKAESDSTGQTMYTASG